MEEDDEEEEGEEEDLRRMSLFLRLLRDPGRYGQSFCGMVRIPVYVYVFQRRGSKMVRGCCCWDDGRFQ